MGIKVQLFGPSRPKANYPLRHRYFCLRPTFYVRIFNAYSLFPIDNRNMAIVRCHSTMEWFSFNVSWKQGVSCSWASLCQTHPAPSAPNNLRDWLMILVSSADSIGRVWHETEELCSMSKSWPVLLFVGLFVVLCFSFGFASKATL